MFNKLMLKERFYDLWKKRNNPELFTTEEKHIVNAMKEHDQYYKLWDSGDAYQALNRQGDEDPFSHIITHTMIEKQLEVNTPEEVGDALDSLVKKGLTRHEAVHIIGAIYVQELFSALKSQKPFNNENYKNKLRNIMN
jgi:hypothetical protein